MIQEGFPGRDEYRQSDQDTNDADEEDEEDTEDSEEEIRSHQRSTPEVRTPLAKTTKPLQAETSAGKRPKKTKKSLPGSDGTPSNRRSLRSKAKEKAVENVHSIATYFTKGGKEDERSRRAAKRT